MSARVADDRHMHPGDVIAGVGLAGVAAMAAPAAGLLIGGVALVGVASKFWESIKSSAEQSPEKELMSLKIEEQRLKVDALRERMGLPPAKAEMGSKESELSPEERINKALNALEAKLNDFMAKAQNGPAVADNALKEATARVEANAAAEARTSREAAAGNVWAGANVHVHLSTPAKERSDLPTPGQSWDNQPSRHETNISRLTEALKPTEYVNNTNSIYAAMESKLGGNGSVLKEAGSRLDASNQKAGEAVQSAVDATTARDQTTSVGRSR